MPYMRPRYIHGTRKLRLVPDGKNGLSVVDAVTGEAIFGVTNIQLDYRRRFGGDVFDHATVTIEITDMVEDIIVDGHVVQDVPRIAEH